MLALGETPPRLAPPATAGFLYAFRLAALGLRAGQGLPASFTASVCGFLFGPGLDSSL
jgi:hypothetical protein